MASQTSVSASSSQLQTINEVISLDDLHNRKYKIEDLTTELQLLKNKISTLRYEMISLMRLLATVNEESQTKTPQDFYSEIQAKVVTLKDDIDTYIERYRKIEPLVTYARNESGEGDKLMNNVSRNEITVDAPIFLNNQTLINNSVQNPGRQVDQSMAAARGGRGGAKRGTTVRKPRGRGGSTLITQRQNSRGSIKGGVQTPQSTEYLGATPSEPILL